MKIGTIIRTKHNTHNYPERDGDRWNYIYYTLTKGPFTIWVERADYYGEFEGKYFLCNGSDYWYYLNGTIRGLDILKEEFEIITELPNNLKNE